MLSLPYRSLTTCCLPRQTSTLYALAALWVGTASLPAKAAEYNVISLGTVGSGSKSSASAVNSKGHVAGDTDTAWWGNSRPYHWGSALGMRIIEIPANATQSQTTGMNDAAQIVGSVVLYQNGRYVWRAFVASQAEGMHLLGTLGGDYVSAATDINNDGEVVGVSTTAEGGYFSFIWDPVRGMRNIYPQGESGPRALNEMGQALCVTNNTNTPRSFIWEKTRGVTFISQAGENFDAADINNNSEAIGTLYAWSGNERLALWNSAQGIRQVGSLSSQYPRTFGVALNDKGQAVGHAFPPSARTGEERAFLWDSAKGIRNLNDLIPPSSGWVLLRAVDINEAGQIVGTGLYNGWPRTFVLTPPIRFLPRQRLFSPAPEALITGLSAGCRLCSVPATGAMLARWRSTIGSMAPLLSSIQLLLTC